MISQRTILVRILVIKARLFGTFQRLELSLSWSPCGFTLVRIARLLTTQMSTFGENAAKHLLGTGTDSLVFLGQLMGDSDDQQFAVKVVPAASMLGRLQLENERRVLRRLSGTPGVPLLLMEGACSISPPPSDSRFNQGNLICSVIAPVGLVLPSLQLSQVISEFGLRIAESLANIISSIHRQSVTIHDIKPSHVVLARDGVYLVDFGAARLDEDLVDNPYSAAQQMFTPAYVGPDSLAYDHSTQAGDWDSFVLTMYDILAGLPWPKKTSSTLCVDYSADISKRQDFFAGKHLRKPRIFHRLSQMRASLDGNRLPASKLPHKRNNLKSQQYQRNYLATILVQLIFEKEVLKVNLTFRGMRPCC